MPNDDLTPALNKLGGDYQVLTELHGEGESRAYLARHLRLNRDVTISVFRAADDDGLSGLKQFASDNRLLIDARHPHVIPIIDGIWLDDTAFATVRARVRGATLDQLMSASGPMSIGRVGTTVGEIAEAIAWARETGVVQRDVAPWDIVFQQGSGRVLLAFEPAKHAQAGPRTECDDAQTLRRLTIEMLCGEINRAVPASEIAVPRSIPSTVADALAAVRYCTPGTARSVIRALLRALDESSTPALANERTLIPVADALAVPADAVVGPVRLVADRAVPTVVQRSADVPSGPLSVITSVPPRKPGHDDPVIISRPSYGFNARLGTAIAVLAIAAVGGYVWLSHDDAKMTSVAIVAPRDTSAGASGASASGEVALHSPPPAVTPIPTASLPRQDSAPGPQRRLTPPPRLTSTTVSDSLTTERTRNVQPDSAVTRKKPVVVDSASEAERQFKRDSAADVENPCLSAESASQHACLMDAIQRNDRELNSVYGRLIAALRRRSGVGVGEPDPEAVNDLRAAQRRWLDERDAACHEVGDEPLYAKSRAACFAQKSTDRARELQLKLDSIPPSS